MSSSRDTIGQGATIEAGATPIGEGATFEDRPIPIGEGAKLENRPIPIGEGESSVHDVAVPESGEATIANSRSQMKFFRASSSFQRGPSGLVSVSRCYAVS